MLSNSPKRFDVPSIASHHDIKFYPFLASPCIAGVRVYINNGQVFRLNGQPIKNKAIQWYISKALPLTEGTYEGVINIEKETDLNSVKSMVDSETHEKQDSFILHLHDIHGLFITYNKRLQKILELTAKLIGKDRIAYVPQRLIYSEAQLKGYEKACSVANYEGIIIRKFDAMYPDSNNLEEQIVVHKPLTLL